MCSADGFAKVTDGIFKIVSMIAIIAGGGWAVHEFYEAKEASRIEKSMEYVRSLESDQVNASIEFISAFWRTYDRGQVAPGEREEAIIQIVREEEHYERHLTSVLRHLDEVAYCIEHQICQEDIVLRSKKGLMTAGFVVHLPWIEWKRKETGYPRYLEHLECFVAIQYPESNIKSNLC